MPIYDYRCDHCGHVFSAVQAFADEALETCPNCGKRPRRLIVPPAIVFKGSGWYKTDSRAATKGDREGKPEEKKPEDKKPEEEKPEEKRAEPKPPTTAPQKPAAKGEAAS